MITLASEVTANVATAEYKSITEGGEYRIVIASDASLGGGTLSIVTADSEGTADLTPSEQSVTDLANIAGKVISLGEGMQVGITLTGSTSPDIDFIKLAQVASYA